MLKITLRSTRLFNMFVVGRFPGAVHFFPLVGNSCDDLVTSYSFRHGVTTTSRCPNARTYLVALHFYCPKCEEDVGFRFSPGSWLVRYVTMEYIHGRRFGVGSSPSSPVQQSNSHSPAAVATEIYYLCRIPWYVISGWSSPPSTP